VQSDRPVDNVGEVKVDNVVAGDDIGIYVNEEVSPGLKQLLLAFEAVDL